MTELELIERIRKLAGKPGSLTLGIGDDCAIYRPRPGEDLLFTSDQMLEGVHFVSHMQAADLGERALARSLSDIAAMGGEPRFCLVSLGVPYGHEFWVEDFFRGLLRLGRRTGTDLAGGDLAHNDRMITCDVTVCGAVKKGRALRRDGARPGDAIYVSGPLGRPWYERIRPKLALGQSLVGLATSCIDLSDGLSLDLHRLCLASGVAAELDRVPVAKGAKLEDALHGGESYELLFTLPAKAKAPRGTTKIGVITRGNAGSVLYQGAPLAAKGYDHFASR